MKSPFLWSGISFALGIILQHYMPELVSAYLPVVVFGCLLLWVLRGTRFFLPLFLITLMFAGAVRAHFDGIRPRDAVENSISQYRVDLEGQVASQPEIKKRGRRVIASFILSTQAVRSGPRWRKVEKKVCGDVQVFWIQPGFIPEAGDTVLLSGRLEKPRNSLNPGGFDHAKYLALKNIFTIIQPIGQQSGRLITKASPWNLLLWIGRARSRLSELIDHLYPVPQSAILKALVIGMRSEAGPVIQNTFMKTGTVHLLAISGLNITMIAGSFFLVFLFLKLPRKITAVLTMVIVIIYIPLAGFGISVQRAGIMALLVLFAILIGRSSSLLNALCVSFFLLLWIDPKSLWNIGFQLSFISVFSLIVVLPFLPRHKLLSLSVGSSIAVLIGTSPVVLYYFNTFSPIGVLANLIAIPVFDAALFSTLFAMIFCKIPLLGSFLIAVSSGLVTAGLWWIKWLSAWRPGYWFFIKPEAWQLWSYYGALGLALGTARVRIPMKKLVLGIFCLCWTFAAVSMLQIDDACRFRVTVLAAGREPVLHIHFSNRADWLVNAGRNFPSDQGERLVLPYLRQFGIKQMDGILFTDLYKKHRGGLGAIFRDISVRRVFFPASQKMPADFSVLIKKLKSRAHVVEKGKRLTFENERMTILDIHKKGMSLLIEAGSRRILFISNLDPVSPENVEHADPDVIILPFLKGTAPQRFWDVVLKKPRTLMISGGDAGVFFKLDQAKAAYFDMTKTGAITIVAGDRGFLFRSFRPRAALEGIYI